MNFFVRGLLLVTLCAAVSAPTFAHAQDEEIWDPLEPMNRGIFWFNDRFDRYLLEPVAKGYDAILPDVVQSKVGNFFSNLKTPVYAVNSLLQFRLVQATEQTGRFLINTTLGIGGLFDVAAEFGLEKKSEDLGITFARWGIPHGPYLVLPFIGPSSLRDGLGRLGDQFMEPTYYVGAVGLEDDEELGLIIGLKTLEFVDTRASLLDAVDAARESAIDEYLFIQSAYYQIRRGQEYDGAPPAVPGMADEDDISFADE